MIQESLSDHTDTKVFQNHTLKNKSGRRREFDVVIISSLNNFEIVIVIECKDWKSKIEAEKIEAFHSKCLRIPRINKKIFVSRHGFQIDAINAAKEFGIELCTFEQINKKNIEEWLTQIPMSFIGKSIKLGNIEFSFSERVIEYFHIKDFIYAKGKPFTTTVEHLALDLIKQNKFIYNPLQFDKTGNIQKGIETYILIIDNIDDLYILDKDLRPLNIKRIDIVFSLIVEELNTSIEIEQLKSEKGDILSTVISHDFNLNLVLKLVQKGSKTNSFDSYYFNKQTGQITETGIKVRFNKLSIHELKLK